jgi:hypothetical protein
MNEIRPSTNSEEEVFKRVLGFADIPDEFYKTILAPVSCKRFSFALTLDQRQKDDIVNVANKISRQM